LGDDFLLSSQQKDSNEVFDSRPTYRWVILTLSWLIYFVFGLIHSTLSILITPVMNDLNLTYAQMGVILGSWQLVYIFFAQPAGMIIDSLGSYKSLFLGVTVISLSAALRWFAVSFEYLLLSVALFGIGGPMISIGLPKLASTWFTGKERSVATGVYTTGNTIGSVVALSATNSFFMPVLGNWRSVFVVYSCFGLVIALLWLFVGWRHQNSNRSRPMAESVERERGLDVIARLFKKRNIWLIVIIGVTSFLVSHGLSNWLPKILELKGMTVREAGFAVSSLKLFAIPGSILIPRLILYSGVEEAGDFSNPLHVRCRYTRTRCDQRATHVDRTCCIGYYDEGTHTPSHGDSHGSAGCRLKTYGGGRRTFLLNW
jgi:cyanate permease